ncbi:MAG TPA: hypothetical protein VFT78_14040 [Hanamia sp.]|nr:hypothetical protein [Hanamia sp.]
MSLSLFNPFETLHFEEKTCFLTGEDLTSEEQKISVFPAWILDRFSLREQKFKMIDNVTGIRYSDLQLPCSDKVKAAFEQLDSEIKMAIESGTGAIKKVPQEHLFLWMGRFVYGVLYHDLVLAISRSKKRAGAKDFQLSPALKLKFSKFHLMLQSLLVPMEFKGERPWSIAIVNLKYSKDIFNYKDEPTNLNFSLGLNGSGIIACLQDNGVVAKKEEDLLKKIGAQTLHPIQFEELSARFLYDNYLLKNRGQNRISIEEDKVIIESFVPEEKTGEPIFASWDDDMFAQVLAGYWEPWGFTKKDIINFPDSPISFLENDFTHDFTKPESIELPF